MVLYAESCACHGLLLARSAIARSVSVVEALLGRKDQRSAWDEW